MEGEWLAFYMSSEKHEILSITLFQLLINQLLYIDLSFDIFKLI